MNDDGTLEGVLVKQLKAAGALYLRTLFAEVAHCNSILWFQTSTSHGQRD